MTFGPIAFAAPGALWALLALPVLYWLLRATPPAPARVTFPPLRLLLGLTAEEQTRARAPLWLVLLRMAMAALAILGFARPSLAPQAAAAASAGPVLIVIDNGWTSAPHWGEVRSAALAVVAEADLAGAGPIYIAPTAPPDAPGAGPAEAALTPAGARALIARLEPQPWRPDRAAALAALPSQPAQFGRIVWLTDGLADPGAEDLAAALRARGPVQALTPPRAPRAVTFAVAGAEGVEAEIRRSPGALAAGAISVETLEGRSLGSAQFRFEGGAVSARAAVALPPEIAARAARVRIVGEASAGAVRLLPQGAGRPLVGLVDPGGEGQPILSELYYVERAIQPFATARRGEVEALISQGAQALILPDASRLTPTARAALDRWLAGGGLLVRFAGPRLANDVDDLIPVRLRGGARALGGALTWETPQRLAPFPEASPFAGLPAPEDVTVRRQVLAEPTAETAESVWARLSDGAALVTAGARGRGLVVLFHVTAGPDWSDLPLSGLYVEMLRRTLAFAGRASSGAAAAETGGQGPWTLERALDGYGALRPPVRALAPVPPEAFPAARAGPATPPGLYARPGAAGAIDGAAAEEGLTALRLPEGIAIGALTQGGARSLAGPLLTAAGLALALDLLLALGLAGALPRLRRAGAAALVLAAAAVGAAGLAPHAGAQGPVDPNTHIPLGYVVTGDAALDRDSREGLEALAQTLRTRTSVEPARVAPVQLARDDLSLYAFLYWPAPATPQRLPDAAIANLDRYLRTGGMVLLDTRDAGRAGGGPGPAAILLQGVDAPPLEPIVGGPEGHVLGRSFYLLTSFPGLAPNARLWGESAGAAAQRDGVPSLFVGDGGWATAWAGRGVSPRTRELALRVGVNLVLVALTGNYKADQVHVSTLLQRMEQGRSRGRRR